MSFIIQIPIAMKFHIPEPCNENWNEMTPTEKGAYCKKCALEVTDFTKMSPFEIRDVLTEKFQKKERNCGHITQRQLTDVNDIGFYWKNEQQRFQSVWMVSLLAVFGLTLFSCQNTYTKELVSKMEDEANTLLQDSTEVDLKKEGQDLTENRSDWYDSLATTFPFEEVRYDGLISWEEEITTGPFIQQWPIITCEFPIMLGDIVTIGGTIDVEPDGETQPALLNPFPSKPQPKAPSGQQINPWPNRKNIGKRADLVYDTETTDFIAYITPAPLTLDSHLIIESFGNHQIHLNLENMESNHIHTDKTVDVMEGVHSFTLGLDKLPVGNYQLELSSWRTAQTIHFQWNGIEHTST